MKGGKYFKVRSSRRWSWESMLQSLKRGLWKNLYYNLGFIILVGVSALIIMVDRENSVGSIGMTEYLHGLIFTRKQFEMQPQWNFSSFSFEPNVLDWDEQRARLMKGHKELWPEEGARPRVMMVTGSSPDQCEPSILSHLLLRSGKNKLDYCRMHDMELYYNMGEPDPDFSDWWVKLPVIRMLMLQHPEFEWIWWLDADAVVTDMSFEPPFAELEYKNLVLYGDHELVYHVRDWTGASTDNFIIRNCQWSLDLLDAWGSMGTAKMTEESGKFQSEALAYRPSDLSGDDQSSMVALLVQDQRNLPVEQKWVPWIELVKETEYVMNGNWTTVGPQLEELRQASQKVPFVTHFAGCLPACTGKPSLLPEELLDVCTEQLGRAFDFADNQVYEQYGFEPRTLGRPLDPLIKILETEEDAEGAQLSEDFFIPPKLTDWNERRQAWMEQHPSTKRAEVLLVSGSAPKPCAPKTGGQVLLRAFKNRIDYARIHGISKVFYNMAVIDKDLTGWWSKLPLLKMLMLGHPNVEWIWWMDSDAAFTDMEFKLPFSRYNASGYNLVMYGSEGEVYDKRKYIGINTGDVLIRNCQWSLDLLDRWASFGATEELQKNNEAVLNTVLTDRPTAWFADDQSVLVYILITEREKWESKVCLESSFVMSGWWQYFTVLFGDDLEWTSEITKPFVTHFAGCSPCKDTIKPDCLEAMDKTYNFADNQVLKRYGLRHVHIDSSELLRTSQLLQVEDVVEIEDFEAKEELEAAINEVVDTAKDKQVPEGELDETKEELEAAMNDVVHTAKDKQSPEGELAETKEELDIGKEVFDEESVAAKEDGLNTGSIEESDLQSSEFDPASEHEELDRATRDEETEKGSKELDLDLPIQEEKLEGASKEELDVASNEEASINAFDEKGLNPDSEELESGEESYMSNEEEEHKEANTNEQSAYSNLEEELHTANEEESNTSHMEEDLTNAEKVEESETPDMDENLTKANNEEEEFKRRRTRRMNTQEEMQAFWRQAKEVELEGSTV